MRMRRLGKDGPEVSALSLGAMGMSNVYGAADEAEGLRTLYAAFDAGITMVDTGDFYGSGHNEMLVGRAIADRRDKVVVAVKTGPQRDPAGAFIGFDASPKNVKVSLAYTLRRLRTDYIDLYMPARVDPNVPIEETVGAMAECVQAGWVRRIGLSEAAPETVRRAAAVHPIAALQIEYSVWEREAAEAALPTLRELGLALTAYGVLSRGLIQDRFARPTGADGRVHMPRFQDGAFQQNRALVEALAAVARDKGCSTAQMAIAWVLSRGDDVIPLVGARTEVQLKDALGALDVILSAEDLARIDAAVPAGAVAGERYPAFAMNQLGR